MYIETMKAESYHVYFLMFGVLGLLIGGALSAQGKGNCELIDESNNETISLRQWYGGIDLKPIDDVTTIDIVRRFKTINVYEIENVYNNDEKTDKYIYADSYYDDENDGKDASKSEFTIGIGRRFNNYEEKETLTVIKLRVEFYCVNDETSEIEFRIPIRDTNNHDPEFLKNSYEYTFPMPIPKGYHLDLFEKVIVRDVDLTNDRITFSFDQNNKLSNVFNISSLGQDPQDKKNYLTRATTASTLDLEDDITFNIIATDSGEPPRTANATFTIKVDKSNSYPRFSQPLYTADLTKNNYTKDDTILVKFDEGNVTVTRGYQGIVSLEMREISDENMKHVNLNYTGLNSDNGMVAFVGLYNVTEEFLKQKTMSFVLAAVRDHVEITTVVQILLPEVPVIESKVPCKVSENKIFLRDDSTEVYTVATIILSFVSLGLTSFIIFLFINKKITWSRFY